MKKSTILMYVFWLIMLIFYFVDPVFSGNKYESIYFAATIIITTFSMYYWFLTDATELDVKPSTGLKFSVVIAGILALPYYLFKYKGFKRSLLSFSKVFGFLIILIVVDYIAGQLGFQA